MAARRTRPRHGTDAPARAALLLGWIFVFSVVEMILGSLRSYLYMRCETAGFAALKRRYHRNIMIQDAAFYKAQGDNLSWQVQGDVSELRSIVMDAPSRLLTHVVDMCVGAAVCMWMDWSIVLWLLVLRLPEAAGITALEQRINTAYERLLKQDQKQLAQGFRDSIENVISVQNMGAEEYEVQLASTREARIKEITNFQRSYPRTLFGMIKLFTGSMESFTQTVLLAHAVLSGRFSVGDYTNYTAY